MGGPLNKTAYWVPSVVYPVYQRSGSSGSNAGFVLQNNKPVHVTDSQGNALYAVVKPRGYYDENGSRQSNNSALFYYKSAHMNDVNFKHIPTEPVPDGLGMIVGNPRNTSAGSRDYTWQCNDSGGGSDHIPNCTSSNELTVHFPVCWDGVNLNSADHRSHMAPEQSGRVCPGELTADPNDDWVRIPRITYIINYPVTNDNATPQVNPTTGEVARDGSGNVILNSSNWFLSSDQYTAYGKMQDPNHKTPTADARPGGYSSHADWLMAWNPEVMNDFVQHCINEQRDCANGHLGNGYQLLFDNVVTDPSTNPTLDSNRSEITPLNQGQGTWQ